MLEEIYAETRRFPIIAHELGIDNVVATTIALHMEQKWLDLKL
ncbi:hypothetical protein [Xenorhabdus sp. KJ12.1]|nr:hypothetical protein [Xenorhabdus sp. KJ12.1]PHM68611.1 phosphatidylinositol kinase [Xenorhabdus sp. KJ12.1]